MIRKGKVLNYTSKYEEIDDGAWSIGSASRSSKTRDKKTGDIVFIKENDSPTYPLRSDTARTRKRLLESCKQFEAHRINIYNTIHKVTKVCTPTPRSPLGNIVNCIDFFRDPVSNRFMEVAPYVEHIRTDIAISRFREKDKERIMKIVMKALSKIHEAGVVHSDLKPERLNDDGSFTAGNIVIVKVPFSGEYTAKLIDFDSSYFEKYEANNAYAYDNCVKGTNGYMSPELIEFKNSLDNNDDEKHEKSYAEKLTTKSDIFTMGIIFHEYLTGKWPITTGKMTVGSAVLENEKVEMDESLTRTQCALIKWMLEKDYRKRPTADGVFEILSGIKKMEDIPAAYWKETIRLETWPEDRIILLEDKTAALGKGIRRSKRVGKYLIGEGFGVQLTSAADLVKMGVAVQADTVKKAAEDSPDLVRGHLREGMDDGLCEPWPEDSIIFNTHKVKESEHQIKRGKIRGQYIIGSGFGTSVRTSDALVEMGLARKRE